MRVAEVVTSQLALNQCRALYVIGCLRTYEKSTCVWNEALLRKYEAATLLPLSTHELLCNFARVKRSTRFSLRVPKARFMGGSPASFFMRFGALHWKKQVLRLAFFLSFFHKIAALHFISCSRFVSKRRCFSLKDDKSPTTLPDLCFTFIYI